VCVVQTRGSRKPGNALVRRRPQVGLAAGSRGSFAGSISSVRLYTVTKVAAARNSPRFGVVGGDPHSPRRRRPSRWASDNCRWLLLDDLQGGRSRPITHRRVVQCRGRKGIVPPAIRLGASGRNTVPGHPGKITYRSWVDGAVPCRLRVRNGIAVLLVSDPHDPKAAARGPNVPLKTVFLDAQM